MERSDYRKNLVWLFANAHRAVKAMRIEYWALCLERGATFEEFT